MEKVTFQDIAHLYIGAPCVIGDIDWRPSNISDEDRAPYTDPNYGRPIKSTIDMHVISNFMHQLTPVLKPIASMTETQMIQLATITHHYLLNKEKFTITSAQFVSLATYPTIRVCYQNFNPLRRTMVRTSNIHIELNYLTARQFLYLLQNHFDLFGFIDSAEAIDEKKYSNLFV